MKKKIIAVVLASALCASLTACQSGSQPAADSAPVKEEPASEALADSEPAAETAEEGQDAEAELSAKSIVVPEGTELNITTTFAGEESNVQLYQDKVQAWMDKTGCVVNDSSATADETMKARVIADFETGAEPDVLFYFNGNDSDPFVEAGKVVSIEEIRSVYPDYADNMKESMLEATASPADGVPYSVPFYGYWEGMFVNKEVCEAAGVEIPGADTSWEEFLEICQTIKDAGYTPIAVSLAKEPHFPVHAYGGAGIPGRRDGPGVDRWSDGHQRSVRKRIPFRKYQYGGSFRSVPELYRRKERVLCGRFLEVRRHRGFYRSDRKLYGDLCAWRQRQEIHGYHRRPFLRLVHFQKSVGG